ncbi:hypothetical protein SLEP1_g52190 [Rubroshorea leprosula]|uniref:Uncharacterized protein n=1 Tax=Rubroshorea leprosula TaxID=152421 RepID=A0AAV5M5K9_9ROSI|nr:hypothetical protein SLEP1_g52190 [Rubroshorea leprosula]
MWQQIWGVVNAANLGLANVAANLGLVKVAAGVGVVKVAAGVGVTRVATGVGVTKVAAGITRVEQLTTPVHLKACCNEMSYVLYVPKK